MSEEVGSTSDVEEEAPSFLGNDRFNERFFLFLVNERIPACLIERSYFGYTMKIPLGMESCK
jgi:hypothetical protein